MIDRQLKMGREHKRRTNGKVGVALTLVPLSVLCAFFCVCSCAQAIAVS